MYLIFFLSLHIFTLTLTLPHPDILILFEIDECQFFFLKSPKAHEFSYYYFTTQDFLHIHDDDILLRSILYFSPPFFIFIFIF